MTTNDQRPAANKTRHCPECGSLMVQFDSYRNGKTDLWCALCSFEWVEFDKPTATSAGAIANDHKRESMIAIDDLSRSIYALDKLAAESELARAALVVLEKQVEILHAKVTAAVSRQRDRRKSERPAAGQPDQRSERPAADRLTST